jgi:cytidyltransferase-like protein
MKLYELTNKPAQTKHVVMTFGRYNPPTIGHGKLFAKLKEIAGNDELIIVPTKTNDPKKNPLTFDQKVYFLNQMFPEIKGDIALDPDLKTIFEVVIAIYQNGATDLTMVVGSDRVGQFKGMLLGYNGKEDFYNFNSINIVSAGERDPDSDGVEGMSASKMREAAANDDYESFQQGLPKGFDGQEMFQAVKQGMGITESNECKTCGGEGVVYWDYDDHEVGAIVKASAPCPDCSVTEDADNKDREAYVRGSKAGKFIYSGWG